MKLHNTLTRKVEEFKPLTGSPVRMYSCGPTVYDHIHIGNLSAFIAADMLRRALKASGYEVKHVMNFTDLDDKTIRRSQETYPDLNPEEALKKLTRQYEDIFLADMAAIGNDTDAIQFVRATDSLDEMRDLITRLYKDGFAYVTDDGVYFSIEKYKASGKTYGQLLKLDDSNTSSARIDNDEYDKESVHDFALWKIKKGNEPAWEFELDGHSLLGRPGWHIECSAMSATSLGQPLDIHTGGIDLVFPHHENEIAQSTAIQDSPVYAGFFVHNEHLLVDGKKMSKSLNNFFTLRDIQEKGYDPLAFRLMILQAHYRNQTNFTWENLESAQNRLNKWRAMASLLHQPQLVDDWDTKKKIPAYARIRTEETQKWMITELTRDLNTPIAINELDQLADDIQALPKNDEHFLSKFQKLLDDVDRFFGINLATPDIASTQKELMAERQKARNDKDFVKSDELRDKLQEQGIGVRDTAYGQIWFHL